MSDSTVTPVSVVKPDGSTSSGSSANNLELNYCRDPLYLHPSDTSGMQLVPNQLMQQNYMIWSRSMIIALHSKNKLGFVDGSYKQPADRTSEAYINWSYVDSAVLRWLLNSMCTDLYETYMYTPTAHQIWKSLEEKYGTSNRPQIHHIKKQLASLHRDCECGSFKKADEIYTENYVDQFLMGLGEEYENVVSNILLMDPIPSYNKVYAMVARVEKQRSVNTSNAIEASALLVRNNEQQRSVVEKSASLKYEDRKKEKASRYCTHCCKTGHTADACFKKHGYPEWFKEYKAQKGKRNTDSVNAAIDDTSAGSRVSNNDEERKMMAEIIQEELKKMMKSKAPGEESPVHARKKIRWIIDSGASSHVTGNLSFLFETKKPRGKNTVQLPDGVNKTVELVGKDKLIKKQLATGVMVRNLYVLDIEEKRRHTSLLACESEDVADLWHNRVQKSKVVDNDGIGESSRLINDAESDLLVGGRDNEFQEQEEISVQDVHDVQQTDTADVDESNGIEESTSVPTNEFSYSSSLSLYSSYLFFCILFGFSG
ncbi:uncharacterized protein G2W53_000925 [Senna tora]|uniref:Retrotransposon Copia-like N-terminal domain-containing protein n=1 Tax=Senna tora TaxID=362788 RepID=A0A835CL15_9FABA|nr:uncharacterized protein G2W53_000925 [Senna tora]